MSLEAGSSSVVKVTESLSPVEARQAMDETAVHLCRRTREHLPQKCLSIVVEVDLVVMNKFSLRDPRCTAYGMVWWSSNPPQDLLSIWRSSTIYSWSNNSSSHYHTKHSTRQPWSQSQRRIWWSRPWGLTQPSTSLSAKWSSSKSQEWKVV